MNVSRQFKKITVGIYEIRLVPALEEMADSLVASVEPLRVAEGKILHDTGERFFSHLKRYMNMVIQKTKGMNPMTKPFGPFLNQQTELRSVYSVIKHIILRVPAKDDVVQGTWIMNSWFS